jgi:hypothetical protein
MKHFIVFAFLFLPLITFSQQSEEEELWASPSVEGMNIGKGIVFTYRRMSPYNIESESQVPELVDDAQGDIERIRSLIFKLRLPVLLRERTQAVVGFEYNVDEFEFDDPESLEYLFYHNLHHKALRGRGFKIYLNHAVDERKFVFVRTSIELNGDIPEEWYTGLKYTVSGSYGWKLNPNTAWGLGFYFSYSFGSPTLLPGIVYNKTWNSKWGLESIFPGAVHLRYQPFDNSVFYFGYEVQGASYNFDLGNTLNEQFDNIQLRRSEVMPLVRYEREIYDFIWFSLEGGARFNFNFNVTEDMIFDAKKILVNKVNSGAFIGGSLFIVPTESLKKLFQKK